MGGDQQTVFFGPEERLSIPAPQSGRGSEQREFMRFLNRQIEKREIPVEPTGRALFLASRNTRVSMIAEFQEKPDGHAENT
jgi:hypothetical protein